MPDIVADVRRAVGFIGRHAGDYAVDPRRLGLWGVSSGGHLALLIGATDDPGPPAATDALVEPPFRAAAIVAYAPPTDLERVLRGHEPSNPALDLSEAEYQAFSPFRHVSSQAPPTLIVHGEADELVALRESLTLYEALRERGVEARLVTIPGARHGFVGEAAELARREAVAWFERYLGVESR